MSLIHAWVYLALLNITAQIANVVVYIVIHRRARRTHPEQKTRRRILLAAFTAVLAWNVLTFFTMPTTSVNAYQLTLICIQIIAFSAILYAGASKIREARRPR